MTDVEVLSLSRKNFIKIVGLQRLDVKYGKRIAISSADQGSGQELSVVSKYANATRVKSKTTKDLLIRAVSNNVMFKHLDDEQVLAIISDMFRIDVEDGTVIIKQGDTGDYFYIVEEGQFEIFVSKAGAPSVNVHDDKGPGKCFGELALLYNAPRNATVIAAKSSVLWAVERQTFRSIISRVSAKKIAEYEAVISTVPILTLLTDSEKTKLAEALELKAFAPQSVMLEQNEKNDCLYIIISGEAVASQTTVNESTGDMMMIEVARLRPGDFFGDKALIQDEIVPAFVSALEAVQCVCLDRNSFISVVGPIEKLIERIDNMSNAATRPLTPEEVARETNKIVKFDLKRDFDIVGTLGSGSFAVVQLVRHKQTGNTYALKKLSRAALSTPAKKGRVLNELSVLAALNNPFLVKLNGTCKDDQCLCFVLEPCLAGELFAVMQRNGRLEEASARFYSACVILGFEAMHKLDIVYRDLKPENLLLADNGYLKIADFGLSKKVPERTWTVCGTPDYLAPEIVSGQGHSKAVDWWTLGVFLYEMLVGEPPFFDEDIMQTYQKIINCRLKFPDYVTPNAQSFISGLLQPKIAKRLGFGHAGVADIKNHPWFSSFDWIALETEKMKAPYAPTVLNREDLSNFEAVDTPTEFPSVIDNSGWDIDF